MRWIVDSTLSRLVRPPRPEHEDLPAFPPPEAAPPQEKTWLRQGSVTVGWQRDVATGETVSRTVEEEGHYRIDAHGLERDVVRRTEYRIGAEKPASAVMTKGMTLTMGRGGWRVRTETSSTMRATPTEFRLEASLEAYEGERLVVSRVWRRTVPRDLV